MASWDETVQAYERSFGTLCAGTVDRLLGDLPAGMLLDVGCGTGGLALRARDQGRSVTAVDASPEMVARAREVLGAGHRLVHEDEASAPSARVLEAALPDLPLEAGSVDAVAANFVINHVARPADCVREIARVLRPGGRTGMTIWPPGGGGWTELVGDAFESAQVIALPPARLPRELDFPRSPEGLAGLARGTGLEILVAQELRWEWRIAVEDLLAGIRGGVATPGATYLAQSPAVRARFEEELRRRGRAAAGPEGLLTFASCAVYVLARRRDGR
ncbi:class I SAM-dependent methyltransferase [Brachybacterium hainanense]|uniref:Class I SAM-dependent methyltransferase n=1 Tax=Brachybacterium hainanense TaxID=1541174 RepID=A0ABV6RCH1_9MICO